MSVSRCIGAMPFLFLGVEDEPGPASERGFIERNVIALLSDYREASLDPSLPGWPGPLERPGSVCASPVCGTTITWMRPMTPPFLI